MTKSAKISCAIAAAILVLGTCAGVVLAGYYLVSFSQGIQLFRAGYDDMLHGHHDAAITHLSAALEKKLNKRNRFYAYLNRGSSHNAKQQFDDAIRDLTEAIRLNPNNPASYDERGWAYQQKGDNKKALQDFSEAIKRRSNSGSAYYNRGLILYKEGDYDRALLDFDEAIRCRPDHADNFFMEGRCYLFKDDLDHALASFDAAIRIKPNRREFYEQRAEVYTRKGQVEKSLFDRLKAERLKPESKEVAKIRKSVASNQARKDVHLDVHPLPHLGVKALSRSNKTFAELLRQARAADNQGEPDRVISLCNEALAMDIAPAAAAGATLLRGEAYFEKGELEQALYDYDHALKLNPKNAAAYVNRGIALDEKGQSEEALKDYEEAIRVNPNDYFAYYNRASAFQEVGDLTSALADYDKAIEIRPADADAYVGRAIIYLRRHEFDNAIGECTTAIQLKPNAFRPYINRAKAYAQKKQYSLSAADLETAIRLLPTDKSAASNSMAWLRATYTDAALRDGQKAVEAATTACELSHWKNWRYIATLAAAYAEAGDFDKAIDCQKRALQMLQERSKYLEKAQQRLALYQNHTPYREEVPQ